MFLECKKLYKSTNTFQNAQEDLINKYKLKWMDTKKEIKRMKDVNIKLSLEKLNLQ